MKNKLLTKVSNIDDISVSVEYFKDKYYPDILKEVDLLESLVEQIKEEPRILYDENYVKGWKDELTIERESIVKIVINLLQSVLNELESAHTLLSSKKILIDGLKLKIGLKLYLKQRHLVLCQSLFTMAQMQINHQLIKNF